MPVEYHLYILIASIVIPSIYGFNNPNFIQKYFYNQGRIQNEKEYYRMLTSSFLHADFIHLFFNMYVLYTFGLPLVQLEGQIFLYLVYFLSVLGGSVLSYFLHQNQWMYTALGASGGVTGVLLAFVTLFPEVDLALLFIPIPIPGFILIFLYLCYEVYMMINPKDNIGHDAHLGGAIVGMTIGLISLDSISQKTVMQLGLVSLPLIYALFYSVKKIKSE